MILCDCLILEFLILRCVAAPVQNMSKLSKDLEQQMLDPSINFVHSEYIRDLVFDIHLWVLLSPYGGCKSHPVFIL